MKVTCCCCNSRATHVCRDIQRDEYFCDAHAREECCERMEES